MGVHGLSTFLKENRHLSESRSFALLSTPTAETEVLVVDGWSFLYTLYSQSGLPWVFGGEYEALSVLIKSVVRAWIRVGLIPYFVFDGTYSGLKIPEVARRIQAARIDASNLFFRTSSTARSSPSFLNSFQILPPFVLTTCLETLAELEGEGVESYVADGEGDAVCVAIAAQFDGYLLGLDTDYLIFNAPYKGYIPIDSIIWREPVALEPEYDDCDEGFQTVRSSKKRKTAPLGTFPGLIPPGNIDSLSISIYRPDKLAQELAINPGLLPLLASLLGNDFTPHTLPLHFFPRSMPSSERVRRAASVIHDIFHPSKSSRRKKSPLNNVEGGDKVTALINAAVSDLSLRDLGEGEHLEIAEYIRDSIFQYLLPEEVPEPGPFVSLPITPDNHNQEDVRLQYTEVFRRGSLESNIANCYTTGTIWPRICLEDPDAKSAADIVGTPLRQWLYAVLADGLDGIGSEEEVAPDLVVEEDDDELIDVSEDISSDEEDVDSSFEMVPVTRSESLVTTSSASIIDLPIDPLALLRTQLETLRAHEPNGLSHAYGLKTADESLTSSAILRSSGPRYITEYLRRGLRLTGVKVQVRSLDDLLSEVSSSYTPTTHGNGFSASRVPIQLHSSSARLDIFLTALKSDTPSMRALNSEWILLASSLRWAIIASSTRNTNARNRWTPSEGRAFLQACHSSADPSATFPQPPAELSTRSIQLTALILAAVEASQLLRGALLLESSFVRHDISRMISGSLFHALLANPTHPSLVSDGSSVVDEVWAAVREGLDEHFAEETWERAKNKKEAKRKEKLAAAQSGGASKAKSSKSGGTKFNLLANLGDDW